MADPLFRKTCISCAKEIIGKPVDLNPTDPKVALCRPCNAAQKAPTTTAAAGVWTWEWFDDLDTYGVRCGDEMICRTSRTKAGYERAKAIAYAHNAAPTNGRSDRG